MSRLAYQANIYQKLSKLISEHKLQKQIAQYRQNNAKNQHMPPLFFRPNAKGKYRAVEKKCAQNNAAKAYPFTLCGG